MAIISWSEHVHNSTELNSCEGTMSRKILGHPDAGAFSTVNKCRHSKGNDLRPGSAGHDLRRQLRYMGFQLAPSSEAVPNALLISG
jgi:hypothetical protein